MSPVALEASPAGVDARPAQAPAPGRRVGLVRALGAVTLGVWAWHSSGHLLGEHPGDALWCCLVGELLLGLGLLAGRPTLAGVGGLWLLYGVPLFLVGLASGERYTLASWVTHTLGPAVALVAARLLGLPRGTWWRASLGLLGLQALSRVATDPALDVNLAHRPYPGWEGVFPSYPAYLAVLSASALASFVLVELALRRLVAPAEASASA